MPHPGLSAVVGRWRTRGRVLGPEPVPVVGTDTYELLDGGHFLIHHVDVVVGDRPVRAVEIVGETVEGGLLARSFDNTGSTERMVLRIGDDGVWRFAGGAAVAPAARSGEVPTGGAVRATLTVAPDGASMRALWERADDGMSWEPWMDIGFSRLA